jgi:hypothetical protein
MADTRTLLTTPADVSATGNVNLDGISVKGGLALIDALTSSHGHLSSAIKMLGDVAVNATSDGDELYLALTSVSLATAFVESVMNAIYKADAPMKGGSAEVRHG